MMMYRHLQKHQAALIVGAIFLLSLAGAFFLPKKPLPQTPDNTAVSQRFYPWSDSLKTALAAQSQFAWTTRTGSKNLCTFASLEPEKELFPLALWVYCGEFVWEEGVAREVSGVSLPVFVTYPNELSFFDTKRFVFEYPRDGVAYATDVEGIFSESVQKQIEGYDASPLKAELQREAQRVLEEMYLSTPITVTGKIVCLSHRDTTGPQTMECAFGLKDEQGREYGLSDPDGQYLSALPMNETVVIEGTFVPRQDQKYAAIGTIKIIRVQ